MSNLRPLNLVVLSAGVGVPSSTRMLADQLAKATESAVEATGRQVQTSVVELRDLAHQVVDMTLTHFPSAELAEVFDQLRRADGVIAVTPTFNTSYSGMFKSFFDVLDEGLLAGVPMLLGATGGTARHSLAVDYALRPMMAYLKADVLTTTVFAATEDFGAATTAPDEHPLASRVQRAGRELAARILGHGARGAMPTAGQTPADRANESSVGENAAAEANGHSATGARPGSANGQSVHENRADENRVDEAPVRGLADEFADFVPMEQLLAR